MSRVPTTPVTTTAFVLYKAWRRLPPHQRRLLLQAVRRHGPTAVAKAASASGRLIAQRRRPS
jgi:hypothetical protein